MGREVLKNKVNIFLKNQFTNDDQYYIIFPLKISNIQTPEIFLVNTVKSIMLIEILTINNFLTIFQIWIQARNKVLYVMCKIKIIIAESAKI